MTPAAPDPAPSASPFDGVEIASYLLGSMTTIRGTVRKLGLEGGIWSLVTEAGQTFELVDAPPALRQEGLLVEVDGQTPAADVSIGMVGSSLRVCGFRPVQ